MTKPATKDHQRCFNCQHAQAVFWPLIVCSNPKHVSYNHCFSRNHACCDNIKYRKDPTVREAPSANNALGK